MAKLPGAVARFVAKLVADPGEPEFDPGSIFSLRFIL